MKKAEEVHQQRQSFVGDVLAKTHETEQKIMVAITLEPGNVYKIFKAGKLKPQQIVGILKTALDLVEQTMIQQN